MRLYNKVIEPIHRLPEPAIGQNTIEAGYGKQQYQHQNRDRQNDLDKGKSVTASHRQNYA